MEQSLQFCQNSSLLHAMMMSRDASRVINDEGSSCNQRREFFLEHDLIRNRSSLSRPWTTNSLPPIIILDVVLHAIDEGMELPPLRQIFSMKPIPLRAVA